MSIHMKVQGMFNCKFSSDMVDSLKPEASLLDNAARNTAVRAPAHTEAGPLVAGIRIRTKTPCAAMFPSGAHNQGA